jgi:hypothetical protein
MSDEGFLTDVGTAMLFFRVCSRYNLTTLEDRRAVLRELVRRKKAKYLRDVQPMLAEKKVLKIESKPPHNPGPEHYCSECRPKTCSHCTGVLERHQMINYTKCLCDCHTKEKL